MAILEVNRVADSAGATLTVPPGTLIYHCSSTAPSGFLKANGALISRSTYSVLFSAIGTTFGVGDGSTTFGLPDMRGEFPRSWADDRAVDTGRAFGSAQAEAYLSHNHGVTDPGHTHSLNYQTPLNAVDTDRGTLSSQFSVDNTVVPTTQSSVTGISINNSGGTETRPRNIALLACIKY